MHLTVSKKSIQLTGIFCLLLSVVFCFSFMIKSTTADSLEGGWKQVVPSKNGDVTHVLLFSGKYFSWTVHKTEDGAFLATKGGSWEREGNDLKVTYEFHTKDSARVGGNDTWVTKQKDGSLQLKGSGMKDNWEKLDQDANSPLSGPWIFSGRKRDGEIQRVDMTTRPRKTMKILTNNRFQWIAFNTETGQFHGTGGGSYTAKDGTYTENIEFFSRDDSRVGASLEFQFEVKDGDWHHSGNNSRGEPMYELWSKRE